MSQTIVIVITWMLLAINIAVETMRTKNLPDIDSCVLFTLATVCTILKIASIVTQ